MRILFWAFLLIATIFGLPTTKAAAKRGVKPARVMVPLLGAGAAVFGLPWFMAALTADRNTASRDASLKSYPVAASTTIYKGSMVCLNASGYATPAANTVGLSRVIGVADEKVDNSSGSAGAKNVRVVSGRAYKFNATSITQAMLGTPMYVVDDNTFDDAAGASNKVPAGVLVEYVSTTEGWIFIETPGYAQRPGFIPLDFASAREITSNDIGDAAVGAADGSGGLLATDTTPAFERINGATDKGLRLRWAASNVDAIQFAPVPLPPDLDGTLPMTIHFYGEMGGATDTPTLTVAVFFGVGDTNAGGATGALADAAGEVSVSIAAADIPEHPGFMNIEVTPGAHTTDALDLYAAWIEYTRKF